MKHILYLLLLLVIPLHATDEFDLHMGKETKHFQYLDKPEDFAQLDLFKKIYDQHHKFLAQASGENKIPKVIHFIWLGPRPFPAESVENVRMWIAHHPDWTVKFWTDRDRHLPCYGMKKENANRFSFTLLGKEYASSTNWGEKSDILRYEILYKEGGVYVDHDANCMCSFVHLNDSFDFYAGLEAPHPLLAGQNLTCGNGVIGSRAGHPVIWKTLQNISARWAPIGRKFRGEDGYNRTERVLNRTYTALTEAVTGGVGEGENRDLVLPAAYFFAKGRIKPLYSEHFYANAWADEDVKNSLSGSMKALSKIEHKMKSQHKMIALILAAQLLVVGLGFRRRKKV